MLSGSSRGKENTEVAMNMTRLQNEKMNATFPSLSPGILGQVT